MARSVSASARATGLVLLSLCLSITIEYLGMHFWWPEQGARHSEAMLERERAFLARNLPAAHPIRHVQRHAETVRDALRYWQMKAGRWWRAVLQRLGVRGTWRMSTWRLGPYRDAAGHIVGLYAVRLSLLCLAAPLFLVLMIVGLVDGLVQRDLRRWGGGRESAYVYHYAKRGNRLFLALAALVYLALPTSVHPVVVLLPFAAAAGFSMSLTASRFKKYL